MGFMHPFASRYVSFRLRAALSKLLLALRSKFVNFAATIFVSVLLFSLHDMSEELQFSALDIC